MNSKNQIRQEIGEKRKQLGSDWLINASNLLAQRFQALEVFQSSEIVGLYKSIGGEASLELLFSKCWDLGKRTCIPVFNEERRLYEMAEITKSTQFGTGHYGIQEPIEPNVLRIAAIDLIAVPGVAFDVAGNRLGRGGGYYDRILAELHGFSVGIAFDFQILPDIPCENHDKPVDLVVTESKLLNL